MERDWLGLPTGPASELLSENRMGETAEEIDEDAIDEDVFVPGTGKRLAASRPNRSPLFKYIALGLALALAGLSFMFLSLRVRHSLMQSEHAEDLRVLRQELAASELRIEQMLERVAREEANARRQAQLAEEARASQERLQELLKKAIESVQLANRDASMLVQEAAKIKPSLKSPLALFQENKNNSEFKLRLLKMQEKSALLLMEMKANGEIVELDPERKGIWVNDRSWAFFDTATRKALIELASDYFAFLSDNTDYTAHIYSAKDDARLASASKEGWVQLY